MAITIDKRTDSKYLVVAFTAFNFRLGMPLEQFFEKAGLANESKLIVTDESRRLTLGGVGEELDTFDKVVERLVAEVAAIEHETLIVTGNSGGAYSAILYSHLLRADRVVCFAPLTYLDPATLQAQKDPATKAFGRSLSQVDQMPDHMSGYENLRNVLAESNGVTEYFIHVAKYHKWDRKRANYLRRSPNVTIREHPYATHGIVSHLAKADALSTCFWEPYKKTYDLKAHASCQARRFRQNGLKLLRRRFR